MVAHPGDWHERRPAIRRPARVRRARAETETTLERNRRALDAIAFRPRVLRNVEHVSTRAKVLGQDVRLPVILAPIGSLQDFASGGCVSPTKAAAKFGALHMLSSACAPVS